ncbi:hypothetical protein C1H46_036174 [Malus baccata]|uniref:Uncharacterized protein n=1 Tax=Malus baccata TaxID=106549 RepID=A0A540KVT2_MALBA|nr:hypothetical protein C1H46_036174 [Malus baccata]
MPFTTYTYIADPANAEHVLKTNFANYPKVPYSMGRMEYNWGPDAASFKPERWLEEGFFQNASPFKFTDFRSLTQKLDYLGFTGRTKNMPRKGLCLPPNEDDTGHSVQILHIHFGSRASSSVPDDDNSVNGARLEAYCSQALIICVKDN